MISFDVESFRASMAQAVAGVRNSIGEDELRAVGFAGAELFRDEARRNAASNRKTGLLYNSIIVKRLEEESDGNVPQVYKVTVRAGRGGAFYWRFVEFGHRFVPRNTKVSKKTGRKIGWKAHRRAAELEYGTASAPAFPYMRPAFESKKAEAVNVMTNTLREQLERNRTR